MARERLEDDPLWHKDAIFYEVRVRSFYDSDGDGLGDFRGLREKLDYLQDLGINAIWLLPFYPSPLRDDGYDISGYSSVHPEYGTLMDFKMFLREAHRRGIRVIIELVVNHTSDQHPWFQRARRAKAGSREREFYVWSERPDRYNETRIIFKDFEPSNWTWDPVAKAYYWHRFYAHQPDLNFDNPAVRRAVSQAMDFWLGLGVDGLRLDAVPYLYEREGTNCENLPETHLFLKDLRRHVDQKFKNRMLLGEANQWPEDAAAYFGEGDECHMAFHFPVMPRMFMALQMEDRYPLIDIFEQTPPIPDACQWAIFLRNHDELTLEMVADEERDYMYRAYARDPQARINLGIRRRLAPLLGNDRKKIELMNSLLFSLPGTPVIYYGDEIGMGDNFYLGDRNGVRTPMQWSGDRNAGFSRANPQRLFLPVIVDPEYHFETVNVEVQQNNPHSLLWWMKRLIALRKQFKAFGRGSLEFLHPENGKVLAFIRRYEDELIFVVANLSRFVQYVELDLSPFQGRVPVELFGRTEFPPVGERPYFLTLAPHTFYWFSLAPRAVPEVRVDDDKGELPAIEVRGQWDGVFRGRAKARLEELLPSYLKRCRWFGGKARQVKGTHILDSISVPCASADVYISLIQVEYTEGDPETYVLPLTFASGERTRDVKEKSPWSAVASLRAKGKEESIEGLLCDALADGSFRQALLTLISRRRRLKGASGEVLAVPSRVFERV
ncbi:MAG: maltose alpha-D-glucosyltransferase, partial [Nitrospinota bacterium]